MRLRSSATGLRCLITLIACCAFLAPVAHAADQGSTWGFAPAQAPPPPSGASPSPFPTALGKVGDIEFWAPNRGVLITAGNALVSPGLYAYDGVSWHQLSTVCGGTDGRIAWAGPDEFWTISDQRPGQITPEGSQAFLVRDVSLCHFMDGQVVGSYAMPLDQPDSYEPMDAAACQSPSNCWFGGELDSEGAFHLHWNGNEISVVNAPQLHAVASMAVDGGQIYESVQLAPGDDYRDESTTNPPLLHTIVASDPNDVFHELFPVAGECSEFCSTLPDYGTDETGKAVAPETLSGLRLSSDGGASGVAPGSAQLWAVAGPDSNRPPANEGAAHPIALRYRDGEWKQIVPNLATFEASENPGAVAADPGEEAAWIAVQSGDEVAHVDLLSSADGGQVSERDLLGPEQGVGPRGNAGPIACPAPHECWLATDQGWLFHLTEGASPPPDADPMFNGGDGVITHRPPDNGVPEVPPDQSPEDDSLANQAPAQEAPPAPPSETSSTTKRAAAALVEHVHSKLLKGNILRLSFTLVRAAHVQLLASRHGVVIARTRRQTLKRGSHSVELHLSPRHWPTKLDLRATPVG